MKTTRREPCTIRPARPDEAADLSRLALRSKAHWGYAPEFMAACAEELSFSPEQVASPGFRYVLAEVDDAVVGYYALELLSADELELDSMFVEPDHIGTGVGRALMDHAKRTAVELGGRSLVIQGDPHAEAFYRAAGAIQVGEKQSGSVPGRFLPLFRLPLGTGALLTAGAPGTYILLIELAARSEVQAGRSGTVNLEPGLYGYVGSALGPGGLAARLRRHASRPARKHWHVDHLLGVSDRVKLAGALVIEDGERRECAWASWVEREALATVDGFGASDCRCRGHLFQIDRGMGSEARDRFAERAWHELGARPVPIDRLAAGPSRPVTAEAPPSSPDA